MSAIHFFIDSLQLPCSCNFLARAAVTEYDALNTNTGRFHVA